MYPQAQIQHNIGNTIKISNELAVRATTYLSDGVAIGSTTIATVNAGDFSSPAPNNILIVLSGLGNENSELTEYSALSSNDFTTPATTQTHYRGDTIQEIQYDQIEVQKSATIDGTYSAVTTLKMQVTQGHTIVQDTSGTQTEYYRLRFVNSITSDTSEWSTPVSVDSYSGKSAGELISSVKNAVGVYDDDQQVTLEFMLQSLNDARDMLQERLSGVRFPWLQEFEYPIRMLAGRNYVDLPDDIDYENTDRSLLSARFLVDNIIQPYHLNYVDKRKWNVISYEKRGSFLANGISIGATTIDVENVGDFYSNGGSAFVATTEFDQDIMNIEYTGIDIANNQLTGVTGVTRNVPVGTQIFAQPTFAQPTFYTVYDDKIYFDRVIPDTMQGRNVYIDYYKRFEPIRSLYEELPEPYRTMYKSYLRYAIKYRRDNSINASEDADYQDFEKQLNALYNNLYTGQDQIIITN